MAEAQPRGGHCGFIDAEHPVDPASAGRTGVDLPPIPDATRDRILEALPTMGYVGNPFDPWGAGDPWTPPAEIWHPGCFPSPAR